MRLSPYGHGPAQPGGLCPAGQAPRAGRAPVRRLLFRGAADGRQVGRGGQSPEAAEESGSGQYERL